MQPTRRSYSKCCKAQVIKECGKPGASIAGVALSYSLNANLVHKGTQVQAQKSTALQPAFIPSLIKPAAQYPRQISALRFCTPQRYESELAD